MRLVATLLVWLLTTIALAAAVPSAWIQRNVVDVDGYAALAQRAAADPDLQSAMAAQLSTRAMALIAEHGGTVDGARVHQAAAAFTAGPAFPGQFAQANRVAHRWMFADTGGSDRATVDLAPMLHDPALHQVLDGYGVQVPPTVTVPLTAVPDALRPGQLQALPDWGPRVAIGSAALAAVFALLTLAIARRRGMVLAGLGVAALLVGAAGWAGIEVGRRHLAAALNATTTGDVRQIADVLVGYAVGSAHQWLNLTLAAGGALVVFGVFVAILGGLRKA